VKTFLRIRQPTPAVYVPPDNLSPGSFVTHSDLLGHPRKGWHSRVSVEAAAAASYRDEYAYRVLVRRHA